MGNKTRGKKRVALLLPAELVDRIDRDAHDSGITRTKYITNVLMGDWKNIEVKDKVDAIRHLLDNPANWIRLPMEFQTIEVFRALVNLDQNASAAILEHIPYEWWKYVCKEAIVNQAVQNGQILRNLPQKYRRDTMASIRKLAKKAWEEYDKTHVVTKKEQKKTSPKGEKERKQSRAKKPEIRKKKKVSVSEPGLFDVLQ